jgi:predicted MFS family arabinose efflux permease
MSLLGFLFGPALIVGADWVGSWVSQGAVSSALSARLVIVLSALLGTVMMLGLAQTLPAPRAADTPARTKPALSADAHIASLLWLSGTVMFVLAGFELGIVMQGQQHADVSTRQVAMMFAECSLVMLGVNALLFFTSLLEKASARTLVGIGLILATVGLALLARHRSNDSMYWGISLASAGTGLVLPVIAYLAAASSPQKLGTTMGGLAAAAGLGQTLGSAVGGWLFGALAQRSFGWLTLPLVVTLLFLLVRPRWLSVTSGGSRDEYDRKANHETYRIS